MLYHWAKETCPTSWTGKVPLQGLPERCSGKTECLYLGRTFNYTFAMMCNVGAQDPKLFLGVNDPPKQALKVLIFSFKKQYPWTNLKIALTRPTSGHCNEKRSHLGKPGVPKLPIHGWVRNHGQTPIPHVTERATLFDSVGFLRGLPFLLLHYITSRSVWVCRKSFAQDYFRILISQQLNGVTVFSSGQKQAARGWGKH
jgi:hypothetical protein